MEEKYNTKRNAIFDPARVQKWNEEKNQIVAVPSEFVDMLAKPFDYLRKNAQDGYSNFEELQAAKEIARKDTLVRVKKLEDEKRNGYIAISTLTVGGFIAISTIIFLIVGTIVRGWSWSLIY